jgi:hypothetical protein
MVIDEFLAANNNFIPDYISPIINKNNIEINNINTHAFMLNIDFTQSNADGFFMARMKRIE